MADIDASGQVHEAVVAALRADAGLARLVGARVYGGEVPQTAGFPFVTVSPALGQTAAETVGSEDWETVVTVSAWARGARAEQEVHAIARVCTAALHMAALTVAGRTLVHIRHVGQTPRDAGEADFQMVQRFSAIAGI